MSDERKTLQQEERKPQRTQIMTLKEVAKYLGVHTMTVYRLLKEKKLPGFKVGGQWRTKKDVLDSYLLKEIDRGGQDSKKK
ncbi:MAG: helix-turn-helix domain-containing protein [Candidatus Omnitrophica bacterium]|nr:helix-turn-helix domain-containing protein [Candidatus Omnitrophota bacterium]